MTIEAEPASVALAAAERLCAERGERLTARRRRVLDLVLNAARPLTAYDILDRIKPEDRTATAVGVYRSLDFLMALGVVHRVETTRSFIGCTHPDHPHATQFLICRNCGTVVETEDKRVGNAAAELGQRMGFAIDQPSVEMTGLCHDCSA